MVRNEKISEAIAPAAKAEASAMSSATAALELGLADSLLIVEHAAETKRAAHEHDALDAEVEVAGALSEDFAQRAVHQNCTERDGSRDQGNDRIHHTFAPSFALDLPRKMI